MDIKEMSTKDQINYWVGQLCLAIGQGDVRTAVSQMIFYYQQEAYQRGVEEGKKQSQKG